MGACSTAHNISRLYSQGKVAFGEVLLGNKSRIRALFKYFCIVSYVERVPCKFLRNGVLGCYEEQLLRICVVTLAAVLNLSRQFINVNARGNEHIKRFAQNTRLHHIFWMCPLGRWLSQQIAGSVGAQGWLGLLYITLSYTLWWKLGASLIIGLMGPPHPQCSRLNWLFRMICNVFFGVRSPSPVLGLGLFGTIRQGYNTMLQSYSKGTVCSLSWCQGIYARFTPNQLQYAQVAKKTMWDLGHNTMNCPITGVHVLLDACCEP